MQVYLKPYSMKTTELVVDCCYRIILDVSSNKIIR